MTETQWVEKFVRPLFAKEPFAWVWHHPKTEFIFTTGLERGRASFTTYVRADNNKNPRTVEDLFTMGIPFKETKINWMRQKHVTLVLALRADDVDELFGAEQEGSRTIKQEDGYMAIN